MVRTLAKKTQNRKRTTSNSKPIFKKNKTALTVSTAFSEVGSTGVSTKTFLLLTLGIFLVGLIFIQMDQFHWLGVALVIPERFRFILLMLGITFSAFGIWKLPTTASKADMSRRFAYPLLVVIVIVGTVLRFIRAGQAFWAYWGDPAMNVEYMIHACDFHWFPVIYPGSASEPLYTWVGGVVSLIFPTWKALFVQRFTGNLFNIPVIWLCYRLGREVSGKRTVGVVLAALVAASKPLILLDLSGMGPLSSPLAIALYLWFQFRLFKKPNLSHFLQWGAILAFGLYTYNATRPWPPFLIVITLGWILWKEKQDKVEVWWPVKSLTLLFSFCYLLFYVDNMLSVLHGNPIAQFWGYSVPLWVFIQIIFLIGLIYGYRVSGDAGKRLCGWAMGVMVAGVLSHPLALHTESAMRIHNQSLLPENLSGWFSMAFINKMIHQNREVFYAWFVAVNDRSDMNVMGDALFDYHADVLVVLGVIYAAVRLSWKKSFLFVCAIVGSVPYLLTTIVYSAKLLCSVIPLLLLAALFLGRVIEAFLQKPANKNWIGAFIILLLLSYWTWEIKGTYERVYDTWWTAVTNDDVRVGQEALKVLPNNRVYLTPQTTVRDSSFFDWEVMVVLLDRNPAYTLVFPSNIISVGPSEKRKDVTVVVSPLSKPIVDRLKKEFPKATWTPGWQFYQQSHNEVPFLYTVTILASDIPEKPGKMFQFHVVADSFWRRYVYFYRLSLREGAIEYEDASPILNSPLANATGQPVAADGEWVAPADGNYTFSIYTGDYTRIQVDNQVVIDFIREGRPYPISNTFFFKKGSHHVRYSTYFHIASRFSDVAIESKDLNYKTILGSS